MLFSQLQYLNNKHDWKIMISSRQLFAIIPKKVENWNEEDVKKWFQLNGISINCDIQLEKGGFDGPALLKTTPQFLCFKCGLNKVIMMKVIEWIQYERQEFEELVQEELLLRQQYQIKSSIEPTYRNSRMNIKQIQKQQEATDDSVDIKIFATEKNKENAIRNNQKSIQVQSEIIQPSLNVKKWKKKEPIQKSPLKSQKAIQVPTKERPQVNLDRVQLSGVKMALSNYEILQNILVFEYQGKISTLVNSGKMGRNITNDVIFIEESISREHALIVKQNGEYFLMDNQSRFGSFVQIGYGNRKIISEGDIITVQNEEFQIMKYKYSKNTHTFELKIRKFGEIQEKNEELTFSKKKQIIIGTDNADISYPSELINPNHAKLTYDRNGMLNITQMGGRCFRKLKKGELFKLDDEYQRIRFGLALITVKLKSDYKPFQIMSAFQLSEQN